MFSTMESYFLEARKEAVDQMIAESVKYGSDTIVTVRFNDVLVECKGRQMALVSVHGTAVRIKN